MQDMLSPFTLSFDFLYYLFERRGVIEELMREKMVKQRLLRSVPFPLGSTSIFLFSFLS